MKIINPLMKVALMSTVGMGSIMLSTSAYAQQPRINTADENDEVIDDEDGVIDKNVIIVTASKRETTLQELPVAVSVTSADTIEQAQIRDLLDLQSVVPSLSVGQLQSSANTNFIIRGFGNGANNPGIEPSVGVFIDGVYRSRSAAQIGDLPNIQRVEVLRGPQSTLFGKNASAGVISIITQEPQFEFGGSVSATYGNFNTRILKGDVTGPITDTIAFALSGNINKRDGYARDLNLGIKFNDRDRWGVRGQILFEPNDALKIRLIGDYDNIDENCCVAGNIVNGPTGNAIFALGGAIDPENPFSYRVFNNLPSTNEIENYGGSAQIDYELGSLTLTSITAYREVRSFTNQDSDFTSADLIGENAATTAIDTFTQELRVASDFDGPLNFLLGGYYFDEDIDFRNTLFYGQDFRNYANLLSGGAYTNVEALLGFPTGTFGAPGQGNDDNFTLSDKAYSIFGTVDFDITDKLTLSGGFNYTDDSKRATSAVVNTDVFSSLDFVAIGRGLVQQQAFATAFRANTGLAPTPANIALVPAAVVAQIQAGASAFATANATNAAVNPLLALRPLQFLPPFLNFPNAVEDGRTDDDDVSFSIRASYELTDNINIYATYATGYKAPSFNLSRDSRPFPSDFIPGSPVTNPPASPIRNAGLALPNLTTGTRFAQSEKAKVYEFGLKGSFERVAFNLAVFDQTIEDFQSNVFTGTGFALANAGKQSTFGIEFDGTVTPVDPLTIFMAVTYLDPIYDSFPNSSVGDLTGETPAGIPDISMSVGAAYTQEFGNGTLFILRGDYQYESEVQLNEGINVRDDVNSINAAATLKLTNGLELSIYGRNLNDDQRVTTVFPSVAQAGSISGYPNQPRTYGGSVRYKF